MIYCFLIVSAFTAYLIRFCFFKTLIIVRRSNIVKLKVFFCYCLKRKNVINCYCARTIIVCICMITQCGFAQTKKQTRSFYHEKITVSLSGVFCDRFLLPRRIE